MFCCFLTQLFSGQQTNRFQPVRIASLNGPFSHRHEKIWQFNHFAAYQLLALEIPLAKGVKML
jgi:hypothetical protein